MDIDNVGAWFPSPLIASMSSNHLEKWYQSVSLFLLKLTPVSDKLFWIGDEGQYCEGLAQKSLHEGNVEFRIQN
jgi:hypothetical protein